jgi:hypothetical protein
MTGSNQYKARKKRGHPAVSVTLSKDTLRILGELAKDYEIDRSALIGYLAIYHVMAKKGVLLGPPQMSKKAAAA